MAKPAQPAAAPRVYSPTSAERRRVCVASGNADTRFQLERRHQHRPPLIRVIAVSQPTRQTRAKGVDLMYASW